MLSQGAAISPRGSFSIINSLTRFLCSHQAVESVCHNCSVIQIVSRVLIRSLHVVSLTYPLLSCDLGRVLLFLLGGVSWFRSIETEARIISWSCCGQGGGVCPILGFSLFFIAYLLGTLFWNSQGFLGT